VILKLWCKGTNKRENYNGINAEPLTFDDTSCKIIRKVSFAYIAIYQTFRRLFALNNDTFILFPEKTFLCRK